MSKRIHIFGCSFVEGQIRETECLTGRSNFPEYLSLLAPNLKIYNWGVSGTSINYHLYLSSKVKQFYNTLDDVYILKCTTPGRLTSWKVLEDHYFESPKEITSNYHYQHVPRKKFKVHNLRQETPDQLANYYFLNLEWKQLDFEYTVSLGYAENNFDFVYSHHDETKFPCIRKILGKEKYQKYIKDDGRHFGDDGNKWEAQWLFKKLTEKELV